ncbi:Armadillo repeat-containing X-linked protein 2 [Labeo rohita]|uniref:Armadillo repeat-containing X-linked protein 2 n=1 Tax=Labeo rohita TaxID=84645 RepID=A0ABQ8M8S9_LABRO|nr:Armadillo repeat-containing X-linked protein 2 [Labeo rohita]
MWTYMQTCLLFSHLYLNYLSALNCLAWIAHPPSLSCLLLSPPIIPAASALPTLSPGSPSAHPQPTICAVGSPRVCQSPSASWLEDPRSLPEAYESRTLRQPFHSEAPPGSFIPLALPWLVINPLSPQDSAPPPCSSTLFRFVPPTSLGSSLPPAPPGS